VIGRDQMAGAGHVFNDDARLAGHMSAEMARQGARVGIETAAGRSADDHPDRLSFVEIFCGLCGGRRRDEGQEQTHQSDLLHLRERTPLIQSSANVRKQAFSVKLADQLA